MTNLTDLISLVIVLVVVASILGTAINILREYERGVVFLLGRFYKVKGPGLILIIPIIQKMERVDLRTIAVSYTHLTLPTIPLV